MASAALPLLVLATAATAAEPPPPTAMGPERTWWTRERKATAVIAGGNAAVLAYGFAFWDYGSSGFSTQDEGWFAADTDHGGADKLGHAYSAAMLTNVSANLFREWGYDHRDAAGLGAVLGLSVTGVMELGDGISNDYGFSNQDMVANLVGTGFGYLRARFPAVAQRVDFRAEYWPSEAVTSGASTDIVTDYEGMRYLLAAKGSGFIADRGNPLRFLELHLGYYTRGFDDDAGNQDDFGRRIYLGVGVDLGELWHRWRGTEGDTLFSYYQVPYTSLRLERNLDD